MSYIASRLSVVQPSASMAVSQAAKALRREGHRRDRPRPRRAGFPDARHIVEAAYMPRRSGDTLYTAAAGTPALRHAIAAKFAARERARLRPDEIVVANGAKQIIFNALMATLEPGDEVILPGALLRLLSGDGEAARRRAGLVDASGRNGLPADARGARSARSRRAPSGCCSTCPAIRRGAVYSEAELAGARRRARAASAGARDVGRDLRAHHLRRSAASSPSARPVPELHERTLIVNGVSKAYAMTGWRVGYAAGPHAAHQGDGDDPEPVLHVGLLDRRRRPPRRR